MISFPGLSAASVRDVPPSRAVCGSPQTTPAAANKSRRVPCLMFWAALSLSSLAGPLHAQTTIDTGSVVGTVSEPTSAVISGAEVAITNVATGQVISLTTNASGAFNSGALVPGNYKTQISAKGFSTVAVALTVLVGNTATMNVTLQVGPQKTVIQVQDSIAR